MILGTIFILFGFYEYFSFSDYGCPNVLTNSIGSFQASCPGGYQLSLTELIIPVAVGIALIGYGFLRGPINQVPQNSDIESSMQREK